MAAYVTTVGMEVHAELLTRSKMFCRCPVAFGGEPNTRVCPVCLGLPGALPVPNRHAIELVLKTALALNCRIAARAIFHRKNYFYPDLPKGYQISQYGESNPLGHGGWLEIPAAAGGHKRVRIRRVHLEEDTGKLAHMADGSGVDYNRAGVPLMEIVTDFPPDIEDPEEAREYLTRLRQVLVYLGVCDGKMEEGSLRCEPNVSVRPAGSEAYGAKTELKNLNSFRSVLLGIRFEARRQIAVIEQGGAVLQETRGWNEASETSFVMRSKEEEQDYRYFPCPDLAPMEFAEDTIAELRASLPELPLAKAERYQAEFGLSAYDAGVLTAGRDRAAFFEAVVALGADPKTACNWINGDLARLLNERGQRLPSRHGDTAGDVTLVTPQHLAGLLGLLETGAITGKVAKGLLVESFVTGESPGTILEAKGLTQISDPEAIEALVREVLAANAGNVARYRAGQPAVLGFLAGQVMKGSKGRANPALVQALLRRLLDTQ
jgi:aspartyl-tRNA(Asn)/glutamyl-tRNA(Gln) amidotransferase subunit B